MFSKNIKQRLKKITKNESLKKNERQTDEDSLENNDLD
jgi:hypothetical protein